MSVLKLLIVIIIGLAFGSMASLLALILYNVSNAFGKVIVHGNNLENFAPAVGFTIILTIASVVNYYWSR